MSLRQPFDLCMFMLSLHVITFKPGILLTGINGLISVCLQSLLEPAQRQLVQAVHVTAFRLIPDFGLGTDSQLPARHKLLGLIMHGQALSFLPAICS